MITSPFERTSRSVSMTSDSMRWNSLPGSQNLTDTVVAPCDDLLDGLVDRRVVEAVQRLQVILIADRLVELGAQANALERRVAGLELRHHLGDSTAQAAVDAMLLEREDVPGLGRRARDGFAVDRLDGVHAEQPHAQSFGTEVSRHAISGREHPARGDEGHVVPLPQGDRAAQLEIRLGLVHDGFAGLAEP